MATLLYSQAEFQAAVDALKGYVGQLESVLSECEAKKSEINNFWDDASGQQYSKTINDNITVCKNTIFDTNIVSGFKAPRMIYADRNQFFRAGKSSGTAG